MIYLHLRVKFRFMFVTLGQVDQKFMVPLGVMLPSLATTLFNDRGVYLRISNEPIA